MRRGERREERQRATKSRITVGEVLLFVTYKMENFLRSKVLQFFICYYFLHSSDLFFVIFYNPGG